MTSRSWMGEKSQTEETPGRDKEAGKYKMQLCLWCGVHAERLWWWDSGDGTRQGARGRLQGTLTPLLMRLDFILQERETSKSFSGSKWHSQNCALQTPARRGRNWSQGQQLSAHWTDPSEAPQQGPGARWPVPQKGGDWWRGFWGQDQQVGDKEISNRRKEN